VAEGEGEGESLVGTIFRPALYGFATCHAKVNLLSKNGEIIKMCLGINKVLKFFFVMIVMFLIQIPWLNEESCLAVEKGSTVLSAEDKEADAKIRAVWNAMKAALRAGDANKAVSCFSPLSTSKYKEIFFTLKDDLPSLENELGNIEFVYIKEDLAKYEIKKDEVINGESNKMNYDVYFVRQADGNWYIDQF
jgi:hypothetical protein